MSLEDRVPVPMNKFTEKDGKLVQHKNKRNNPVARKFTNDTADFTGLILKHFAPLAHFNMSNHIRLADQCQVGTLGIDNAFTCIALNGDLMSK